MAARPQQLRVVNSTYRETNLTEFAEKLNKYRRVTGKSQLELAGVLALHSKVLSRKLSPNSDASLTHPEIKQIIKTLAEWHGIVRQQEAVELLELVGLRANIFTDEEWASPPLNQLEKVETDLKVVNPADPIPFKDFEPVPAHNLPAQLTRFIGREKSVTRVVRLLSQDFVRLVTVLGPGGMGKTRLSLEVARKILPRFENGIRFVPLAGLTDPALLPTAIAQTLGVKESSKSPLIDELKNYLRDKQILLLLDNFEQLVESSPLVSELLEAAPRLKVLVTSRVILHLYGETEYNLAPLELPDTAQEQNLEDSEAVSLFVERVRAFNPDFEADNESGPIIARICARLDGLPLALELAAATIRQLSFEELYSQLETSSLEVLKGGARNLPVRHQALRNTLEWSYKLLQPEERRWFFSLSLFRGGWSSVAAHAVCSLPGKTEAETVAMLNTLVEKSLITAEEIFGDSNIPELRYNMLETVREYAQEHLYQTENYISLFYKHANYYLNLAEQSETELYGHRQVQWLALLDHELNNFSRALGWLAGTFPAKWSETASNRLERLSLGLKLSEALYHYWNLRGYFRDGYSSLKLAIAQVADEPVDFPLLPKALNAASLLASVLGNNQEAAQLAEQSLSLSEKAGDTRGIAEAKNCLAVVAFNQGNFTQATNYLNENIPVFRELNNQRAVAGSLEKLGNIYRSLGEDEKANTSFQESLALYRQLGNKYGQANILLGIAHVANMAREMDIAERYYLECLEVFQELNNKQGLANVFNGLGVVAFHRGDIKPSKKYYEKSLELFRLLGNRLGINSTLINLGNIALSQGEDNLAFRNFEQALSISNEMEDKHGISLILHRLGTVLLSQGALAEANKYFRLCIAQSEIIGDKQNLAKALRSLGDIALLKREREEMLSLYQESLLLSRQSGSKFILSRTLLGLVLAEIILNKNETSILPLLKESIALMEQMGDKPTTIHGVSTIAIYLDTLPGSEEKAATVAGTLEASLAETGIVLEQPFRELYSKMSKNLRGQIAESKYNRFFEAGKKQTLIQAISLLL